MPDARLSINALVNGPVPTTPSPGAVSPSSSSVTRSASSPSSFSYVTWARDSNVSSPPAPPPLLSPVGPLLAPLRTPSPPRRSSEPLAPTSPQTVIVKTPRGKRHRCNFRGCGRDFTRLSNLKAHWRRHSGEEPYACMHCTRKFKWRSSLKSHELGCVYEFKANSGLQWVYVSTDRRPGSRQLQSTQKAASVLRPLARETRQVTSSPPYHHSSQHYDQNDFHSRSPGAPQVTNGTYA